VSNFLRTYLDLGLSEIVQIYYDWHEEKSGYGNERTDEIVIARKASGFVKVAIHLDMGFGPAVGGGITVAPEEKITEAEYKKLANGKSIIDTPQALAAIAAENEATQRRDDLQRQFYATAPKCPKCRGGMRQRRGTRGPFWGCQRFPHCNGMANFSEQAMKFHDQMSSH